MSTTTDKLALFKYDPSTDGAQTFNIQKALNDNWDRLDDAVKEILITLANKAPGGFGLGGNAKWLTEADDVNAISESGWYAWDSPHTPKNAINLAYSTIMRVDAQNAVVNVKTIYGVAENLLGAAIVARNMTYGSHISDWEYENPPMTFGVEYRTTERCLGKPVYVKTVDFGALPNASYKFVGIENGASIIRASGIASNGKTIPGSIGASQREQVLCMGSGNSVEIITYADASSLTATVTAWYTKTAD